MRTLQEKCLQWFLNVKKPHNCPTILSQLHVAHQGMEKTKLHARSAIFWPSIYDDIETLRKSCKVCQEVQSSQAREPMIPWDGPPQPWHTVGAELFYCDSHEYLLVNDYHSTSPFRHHMPQSSTSEAVIATMKQIFSEHWIPQVARSDNGPLFASCAFRDFANTYGFTHVTSSPHYPHSNGFIESQVKSVKWTFEKVTKSKESLYLATLFLMFTPIDSKLPSPAEFLQGWGFHDTLLSVTSRGSDEVLDRLQKGQEWQKEFYDQHAKPLPRLFLGQPFTMQDLRSGEWQPGKIGHILVEPHLYVVTTPAGDEVRYNCSQIREWQSND